jgi:hypothetical protein
LICAQFGVAGPDGSLPLVTTPVQPADLSTCAVVLVTGSELSALTGIAFPAPADFGEVWGFGFVMVVSSYVIGWGAGAVLRFFR